MWKGVIQLGKQPVPVKLYAAVQDSDVHFHLLHEADKVRVEQRIVNPETGEPVAKEDIRKGFALRPGVFVMLEPDEIKSLEPPASRDIEVEAFIPSNALRPAWYERPYYVGPDGDAEEYYALVHALADSGRQGIVRWAMRGKRYVGALQAHDGHLALISLRDREEVIETPKFNLPKSRAPSPAELALAEQLVSALEGEFDPTQFRSEYRARVLEMVEQKASGKKVRLVKPRERKASVTSLESVLKASVKAAGPTAARGKKEKKSA
jgi:DNA end-binding protein Ku